VSCGKIGILYDKQGLPNKLSLKEFKMIVAVSDVSLLTIEICVECNFTRNRFQFMSEKDLPENAEFPYNSDLHNGHEIDYVRFVNIVCKKCIEAESETDEA
jgi:hypothetical protein